MQIRPTIVIPLRPTAGTFWILLGLLFLAFVLIRSDPDYKSEETAEREISLKFRRGSARPAVVVPPHPHPHGFNPYYVEQGTRGQLTPVGLTVGASSSGPSSGVYRSSTWPEATTRGTTPPAAETESGS